MRPKKKLGQHFLTDESVAYHIVEALDYNLAEKSIDCLEIGPGKGVLTKYLIEKENYNFKTVEIDEDVAQVLKEAIPKVENKIILNDILNLDFEQFTNPLLIIGNLPYNITAPIFFKVLENKDIVHQAVFMIQKEVADRIVSPPGNKTYGILSVLLGAYYNLEYILTVEPDVFIPPPKVRSAVIRLTKLDNEFEITDWRKFKNVVKAAFNQRRKTLRNALSLYNTSSISKEILQKRAEHLSVSDFIDLYKLIKY